MVICLIQAAVCIKAIVALLDCMILFLSILTPKTVYALFIDTVFLTFYGF